LAQPEPAVQSGPAFGASASPSSDDPVFLPDFVALTPDQMQEILYRKGQDQ
jgi:hypothetical protein